MTKELLDFVLKNSPPFESEEMLGKTLVKNGYLNEEQLFLCLAEQLSMSFYPKLKDIRINRRRLRQFRQNSSSATILCL